MRISIVGGGRWARTIAAVLCSLPRPPCVVVHTLRNAAGISSWAEELRLGDRLRIAAAWPHFGAKRDRPDAVIVANRVRDHFAAALPALRAGVPVMVEKPVALPRAKIAELSGTAEANETFLAASNVLLFARYFDAFAQMATTISQPRRIAFTWIDGPADLRRGEIKSYDAGVTLFDDVLPHIVPMLDSLNFGGLSLDGLHIRRGGAEITIEARSNARAVILDLARDGSGRRRLIEAEGDGTTATLDFSDEPGLIHAPGFVGNGDPLWDSAPRPLATMLTAFLAAIGGQPLDPRLSPACAMAAGALADTVRERYIGHQIQWLDRRLGAPLDAPLHYAFREFADDDKGGRAERIADAWSAIGDPSGLRSLLSQSRLLLEAGYPL
jgi:predicted dehydrogenase